MHRRHQNMVIRRWVGLVFLLNCFGCASFQDHHYQAAQNFRAHFAWWCCPEDRCSANPWSHYAHGWRAAYTDVLMGGDGRCPPVPPQTYWSSKYQDEVGDAIIDDWFHGYRDGSASAMASCGDRFHPVPTSQEAQICLPQCLPTDGAPYPYGKTLLSVEHAQVPVRERLPDLSSDAYMPPAPNPEGPDRIQDLELKDRELR